jgi:hypothetical protein
MLLLTIVVVFLILAAIGGYLYIYNTKLQTDVNETAGDVVTGQFKDISEDIRNIENDLKK